MLTPFQICYPSGLVDICTAISLSRLILAVDMMTRTTELHEAGASCERYKQKCKFTAKRTLTRGAFAWRPITAPQYLT